MDSPADLEKDFRDSIAYVIKEERILHDWSLEDLAGRAGVSVATLTKIESDGGSVPKMCQAAHALGLRPIVIFRDLEDK